jgi:hypothetical protein
MSISPQEAAAALSDIDRTTSRSRELRGYNIAGPALLIWGVVWVLGYSAMGLLPRGEWGLTWLVLDVIGAVLTVIVMRARRSARPAAQGWKIAAGALALAVFIGATFAVFGAHGTGATFVFPTLVCGMVYIGVGLMRMPRLAIVGAAIFVGALVGFYAFQPWLAFWMAGVGGGGLIAGGLWLMKA